MRRISSDPEKNNSPSASSIRPRARPGHASRQTPVYREYTSQVCSLSCLITGSARFPSRENITESRIKIRTELGENMTKFAVLCVLSRVENAGNAFFTPDFPVLLEHGPCESGNKINT